MSPVHVTPFLAGLDDTDAQALVAMGARRRLRGGDTVLHEGRQSENVVLVERGRLKLCCLDTHGKESVLAIVGPGHILGELSAIDGQPHGASAVALEPAEVVLVRAQRFRDFVQARPTVVMPLLRTVTRRLREAGSKQVELGSQDTLGRVTRQLVHLADNYGHVDGSSIHITVPLSQDDLAGLTGSSREAVVKALRVLRERQWIETGRRSVRILDRQALVHQCR